jgi:hypothetical protein
MPQQAMRDSSTLLFQPAQFTLIFQSVSSMITASREVSGASNGAIEGFYSGMKYP